MVTLIREKFDDDAAAVVTAMLAAGRAFETSVKVGPWERGTWGVGRGPGVGAWRMMYGKCGGRTSAFSRRPQPRRAPSAALHGAAWAMAVVVGMTAGAIPSPRIAWSKISATHYLYMRLPRPCTPAGGARRDAERGRSGEHGQQVGGERWVKEGYSNVVKVKGRAGG